MLQKNSIQYLRKNSIQYLRKTETRENMKNTLK